MGTMPTAMGQRWFLLLLLPALSVDCSSFPQLDQETARVCPYPWPEDIAPCVCQTNDKFQIFLTCNMRHDLHSETYRSGEDDISKLHQNFQCNDEIFSFHINLNGHSWERDISEKNVGKFKISYFSLSNYSSIDGFFKPGGFSLSKESLVGVKIQKNNDKSTKRSYFQNGIGSGAFFDLPSLTSLTIDEGFEKIHSEAFSNLPSLKKLTLRGLSGSIPKRAFYNMKNLKEMKLKDSEIWKIGSKAFEDLPSLEYLNLSNLGISTLQDDAIYNLPRLKSLDLSSNPLKYIGNVLETASVNMYVNLKMTGVTTISETSFKVFFENILKNNGEGRVDMERLRCSCDIKWLLVSKIDVSNILGNIKCSDGKSINEVDLEYLERLCPQDSCPQYSPDFSRKGK